MMIPHSKLLFAAAEQIDDLDGQARALSNDKKDIYDNVRETISPAEFKAWQAAVKLRQKRRVNLVEVETHESLVTDMLFMLEAGLHQNVRETAAAHGSAPANGNQTESPHTRAGAGGL